ncbi:probable pectinesterase/pectinesterase inhibitor 51 [Chenopodium quinoa]|nr:probable pectinesterase/pectinesterase inhibitor 51 [Chenopodium quinoa]
MPSPHHHLLLLLLSLSTFLHHSLSFSTPFLSICKATQYPLTCQSTLLDSNPNTTRNINPTHSIQTTLSLSSHHVQTAQSLVHDILRTFPNHHNRTLASRTCLDYLTLSSYRTRISSNALTSRDTLHDARAWASAALTYQYDCWSELSYVNGTRVVDKTMSFLNSTLMQTTSNALSLLHALINYGDDMKSWRPPSTERSGFWERGSGSGSGLGFGLGRVELRGRVNVTVCKEGKARGCYARVQEAVNEAPAWLKAKGKDKFVIYIKEGVYKENVMVPLEKKNLVFFGDGKGKTVITGSVNTGIMGISTYNTATVGVKGDGFMASGITFQNTAGPNAHQAVAFRSDSDFSLVEDCEFLGNQDTLYAHSLRQVYRSCSMEGNVDFIFGNAAAIFQDCTILVRPRQVDPSKGENNAITAQGRTDPAEATGFVFLGCHISGTNEYMKLWQQNPKVHKNYLGRPWKMYSRTMFIQCTMDGLISPEGWMPFREDFALSTLYYGEFGNKGPGADVSKRVKWSSRIPEVHLSAYSAQNFIQAHEWSSSF